MTRGTAPWRAAFCLALAGGCTHQPASSGGTLIAQQYGISGVTEETLITGAGAVAGTLVPIVLAGGQHAQLFIPTFQSRDVDAVYLRDARGLHPVRLTGLVYDLLAGRPH